jgi:hypothetical protein
VLPGGFPGDLPLPDGGSLVDFGEAAGGWHYVVIQTPESLAAVRAATARRLAAAGWTAVADGASYQKRGRVVRLAYEDARPGTRLRVEYQPR